MCRAKLERVWRGVSKSGAVCVAREMIGGPVGRPAFTFVAVWQVVRRRCPAEQVRLVLRAVKSRRLDLVSCSGWEPEPELPVAPVAGIEKFQGSVWRPA